MRKARLTYKLAVEANIGICVGGEGHSWGDNDVILLLVLGFVLFCVFVSVHCG